MGKFIGGQLHPGSDAREADFFALEALPERMAFPTDLLICEKLKKLLLDAENGLEQLYEEYSEYLEA
jgi:hypothetical protein